MGSKKKGEKDDGGRVYGVDLSKVKVKVLDKWLLHYGLGTRGDVASKVRRLGEYYKAHMSEIETFAQCEDSCGGHSDASLPECPYCGDADPVDGLGESPAASAPPAASGGGQPRLRSEVGRSAPPPAGSASGGSKQAGGGSSSPKKAAPAKGKASGKPASLAAVDVGVGVPLTESDLDAAVERINSHTFGAASELYRLGQELRKIHDGELWKLRTRDGRPAYNGFKAFVREELKVSSTNAYRLMHVSSRFTEAQLQEFGPHKLQIALQLPPELQDQFLDESRGETRDNVSARARALKNGGGAHGSAGAKAPSPKDAVTVALMLGSTRVPMWKRPTDVAKVGEPTTPATTLKDDPWCSLRLDNNVTLYVRLIRSAEGKIEAIIEARRGEEVL